MQLKKIHLRRYFIGTFVLATTSYLLFREPMFSLVILFCFSPSFLFLVYGAENLVANPYDSGKGPNKFALTLALVLAFVGKTGLIILGLWLLSRQSTDFTIWGVLSYFLQLLLMILCLKKD